MQKPTHPETTPLPTGGLLRLQSRATDPVTWVGPTWAVLCGLLASGGFSWRGQDWLRLALLILLVDGGWGSLWSALGATDWAAPLRRWREWTKNKPTAALPYTLRDAPGGKLSHFLGRLRAWWNEALWPACGPALLVILIALPTTALLATLLGTELILLSVAAVALMQLGVISEGGHSDVPPGWDAAIAVALPWLAGHVTYGPITLPSAGLVVLFAVAWGRAWRVSSGWGRFLTVSSQVLAAALLIGLQRPVAAGTVLLFLVAQLALLPWIGHGYRPAWYVRHARPWLMVAMLVAALAV